MRGRALAAELEAVRGRALAAELEAVRGRAVAARLEAVLGCALPAGLKAVRGSTDSNCMAKNEVVCPICSADVPLSGDEAKAEEVYCTVCGAPLRLTAAAGDDDCEAEEE